MQAEEQEQRAPFVSPEPNSRPTGTSSLCPRLSQGWVGGSGGIKHLQRLGGAWTQRMGSGMFPELFLVLHILSARSGISQTLPTGWEECCGSSDFILEGFCFWITAGAGSSILRSVPAFRSCFSPALSLCAMSYISFGDILVVNVAVVA